jgi:hypothetical protein
VPPLAPSPINTLLRADLLFGKHLRATQDKKIKAMKPQDVMKFIGDQWKACDSATKAVRAAPNLFFES